MRALRPNLRPATADDALCLGVLAMQVFLDTYATDGIRPAIAREALDGYAPAVYQRLLQAPAIFILVAEQHGHLLGFAQVTMGTTHTRGTRLVSVGSAVPKNGSISLVTFVLRRLSGRKRYGRSATYGLRTEMVGANTIFCNAGAFTSC